MNSVKSRGGMMTVVAVLAMASAAAFAQAPPPGGGPSRGGGMGMGGMGGALDRPAMIQRLGLDDATVNLTAAQKTEIDKLVDAYVAEAVKLREKYPMTQGAPPNQEYMAASNAARTQLTEATNKVLTDAQRKTVEAALAERRAQRGPGMGGPGGPGGPGMGGAGGPGRGPGGPGAGGPPPR